MPDAYLNKADLAQAMKTSLPTLDKLIRRHGDDFPVVRRGDNGVAWQFDPAAVFAFLAAKEEAAAAAGRARDELMQQYTLPSVDEIDTPGISPADRVKLAQLRRLERDEQKEAGFLVATSEVRALLTNALTRFNRDMGATTRQALREHNVPEATIRGVEARIADAQRRVVKDLQGLLESSDGTDASRLL